jgi:hypothetical protein
VLVVNLIIHIPAGRIESNGKYYFRVKEVNSPVQGCWSNVKGFTFNDYVNSISSNAKEDALVIYLNPASDQITIFSTKFEGAITIYNLLGNHLLTQSIAIGESKLTAQPVFECIFYQSRNFCA